LSRFRLAGILFLGLLAFFALVPTPFSKGRLATFGLAHYCLHITAFCVAFHLLSSGAEGGRRLAAVAALLVAFGAAVEVLQTRRYGTGIEYPDIAANAAGVLLGYVSRWFWTNRVPDTLAGPRR